MSQEDNQFLKLAPLKGPCEYDDFKEAYIVTDSDADVSGQGMGSNPAMKPVRFAVHCTSVDVAAFEQAVRSGDSSKLKTAVFTMTRYVDGKRKPTLVLTLDNPRLMSVSNNGSSGDGDEHVTLVMGFDKVTKKTTSYKKDGSVLSSAGPYVWDFSKGTYTG